MQAWPAAEHAYLGQYTETQGFVAGLWYTQLIDMLQVESHLFFDHIRSLSNAEGAGHRP